MPNTQFTSTGSGRLLLAACMCALGLVLALSTFDIGPLGVADVNGPAWLGLASGVAFIAAALAVISGKQRPLLGGFFAIVVLICLASIGNWIAFGAGARACGASILSWAGELEGLGCRVPFGIGALITNAIVLLLSVVTVQAALGRPARLEGVRRVAEIVVFLSLAPLLLPILLVLSLTVAFNAVSTRLSTGQWPRNERFIARYRAGKSQNP